jgi:putative oxidoreductase
MTAVTGLFNKLISLFECIPHWLLALASRIILAVPFWKSGQTKIVTGPDAGFLEVAPGTIALFEHHYALPIIPPTIAAYLATYAENILPVLLVIGLATRFSALALLGMTIVIQTFVFSDPWLLHSYWAIIALWIVARGPGMISIDHFIKKATS